MHFEVGFYFVDVVCAHSLLLLFLRLDDAMIPFLANLVVVLDIIPNFIDPQHYRQQSAAHYENRVKVLCRKFKFKPVRQLNYPKKRGKYRNQAHPRFLPLLNKLDRHISSLLVLRNYQMLISFLKFLIKLPLLRKTDVGVDQAFKSLA